MTFWKRQYKISFPEIGYDFANTLKISFSIDKDLTKQTNKSTLKIYNLSETTRKSLEKPDIKCEIFAGHKENDGVIRIFSGTVTQAHSKDNGKDVETEFELSDGQIPVRDSEFALSFAPGIAGNAVIRAIAKNMGCPVIFGEGATFGSFPNGYSFVGKGATALSNICHGSGCTWSIQNGVIQVILENGITANRGIVFAPDSGLIGSPERIIQSNYKADKEPPKRKQRKKEGKDRAKKQAGWKIKTLLAPTITPGDAIKIESRIITGWFKVEAIKHNGDSIGQNWTSEINLIERLTYT